MHRRSIDTRRRAQTTDEVIELTVEQLSPLRPSGRRQPRVQGLLQQSPGVLREGLRCQLMPTRPNFMKDAAPHSSRSAGASWHFSSGQSTAFRMGPPHW